MTYCINPLFIIFWGGVIFWGGPGPRAGQLDSRFITWNRHNYLGGLGRGSPHNFLRGSTTEEWSIVFFMILMYFDGASIANIHRVGRKGEAGTWMFEKRGLTRKSIFSTLQICIFRKGRYTDHDYRNPQYFLRGRGGFIIFWGWLEGSELGLRGELRDGIGCV